MRFFNTSGPVVAADHYCVPPLERINLSDILALIDTKRYFVLHAPRQTGKTSALLALRDLLNAGAHGRYRCVYVNVEAGQAARENQAEAMRATLSELEVEAEATLDDPLPATLWPRLLDRAGPLGVLRQVLTRWAQATRRSGMSTISRTAAHTRSNTAMNASSSVRSRRTVSATRSCRSIGSWRKCESEMCHDRLLRGILPGILFHDSGRAPRCAAPLPRRSSRPPAAGPPTSAHA